MDTPQTAYLEMSARWKMQVTSILHIAICTSIFLCLIRERKRSVCGMEKRNQAAMVPFPVCTTNRSVIDGAPLVSQQAWQQPSPITSKTEVINSGGTPIFHSDAVGSPLNNENLNFLLDLGWAWLYLR